MKKIAVYGMGNFGFALIKHLDKKSVGGDFSLHVYDINTKVRDFVRVKRSHPLIHKNIKISKDVVAENSVKDLIENADIIILAVTSNAIKEVLKDIKKHINRKVIILNTAKALDSVNGERLSTIIEKSLLGIKYPFSVAVLSGGTIAKDLFNSDPLGIDIASKDMSTANSLKSIFTSDNLNVYISTDIAGVEYAAAFKSVVAIAAGIMKGLNFSYGSETHIISRLSGEIRKLVVTKLGGKNETFSTESQCWGNDMLMSATGNTRNREFGVLLGKGHSANEALDRMKKENKTVEGLNTVKAINKIMKKNNYKSYLLSEVSKIILKNKHSKSAILSLMASNNI